MQFFHLVIEQNNFSGILNEQRQILKAYEEDILKYSLGLDKSRIKNIYEHIPVFLAKDIARTTWGLLSTLWTNRRRLNFFARIIIFFRLNQYSAL